MPAERNTSTLYMDFHAADVNYDFWTRLMCVGQNVLEITGTSSMRMNRIDVSWGMTLRPGNTLMRFMKSDASTNMLTLDAETNVATFLGNVVAPNVTTLETKTQNINADGTVLTNIATLNGYKFRESGTFIYNNEAPYIPICSANGIMDIGAIIDFHSASSNEDYRARILCIGTHRLELVGKTSSMAMNRLNITTGLALRTGNNLMRFMKTDGATNMLTLDTDTDVATFSGNVIVPSLNGNNIGTPAIFRYDAVTPFIPIVGSNGITEVGDRIDFHNVTTEEDYTVGLQVTALNRLSIRHNNTTYAGDLELGTTFYKNTGGTCHLQSNHHSNIMWFNNSGTLVWIIDAVSPNER